MRVVNQEEKASHDDGQPQQENSRVSSVNYCTPDFALRKSDKIKESNIKNDEVMSNQEKTPKGGMYREKDNSDKISCKSVDDNISRSAAYLSSQRMVQDNKIESFSSNSAFNSFIRIPNPVIRIP